jgi:hypothetical protein
MLERPNSKSPVSQSVKEGRKEKLTFGKRHDGKVGREGEQVQK